MNHIKKLYEYEDSDLLDLLGDLGDLGFEKFQGWVFTWDSPTEKPLSEVMIASGPRDAFELYKSNGWFGADIDYAEKAGSKFSDLDEVFKYLLKNKIITSYTLTWGLNANKDIKDKQFYQLSSNNPFRLVSFLKSNFDNAEERYASLNKSSLLKLV